MDATLWVNEPGDRFFLVPDTITVQPGTYPILSLMGDRRIDVSEAALVRFEIDTEAARAHFQQTVGPLFEQTLHLLTGSASNAQPDPEAGRALLRQVLSALLGVAPEQLDARPDLLGTGAADLLDQIAAAMRSAGAPSEGQRAFARAQLRKIRKQLRAQGIPADDRLDRIAEQIPHYQERFAALVEQCAAMLKDERADPNEQLRALFDTLERDFGGLLESPAQRERRDEQRRQEYRRSADDAIARSLRAHGITPSVDRETGGEDGARHP
ncbi:MAG TPA: hypothetical protein VFS21_17885 [Roseiflexaceae bacterium]|nr:hypothetical protein [Roseiflexaceae bacterium]